jgi:hypothetical protein
VSLVLPGWVFPVVSQPNRAPDALRFGQITRRRFWPANGRNSRKREGLHVKNAKIFLVAASAAATLAIASSPAAAAPTDDTIVTFEVEAGTLDIVTPATADLGGGAPGTVITGTIGPVTVTDSRASADASWTTSVTSTDFVTGGGTAPETVLASEVDYWSGPATATTGNGTFTPAQLTAAAAAPLDDTTPLVAFTHTGGTGNNTATWNPTLNVNVPLDSIAGTYTGTVTHSVA